MNALAGQIRLDFRADDPIYLQIVRQIETMVSEGKLKPGDQLPTVREMAIDLRINFSTVARAYRILDEQRLISTQRGRGTYIWEDGAEGQGQEEGADGLNSGGMKTGRMNAGGLNTGGMEAEHQKMVRVSNERLCDLAQRFIREAAGLGASAEQIEQVVRQQLEGWKCEDPNQPVKKNGD